MATKTVTLTLPVSHLYYLTCDAANDTGYTVEQVLELKEQYGWDHKIEATITTPVPEEQPQESIVEAQVTEITE